MTKSPESAPDTLYRGVKLPVEDIDSSIFYKGLVPGSSSRVDDRGNEVVRDGNEYGVYMSSNDALSCNYANPEGGEYMPDSPVFNDGRDYKSRLKTPNVGILHRIRTEGIQVRKPMRYNSTGSQNNGFGGDEWIADSVPASNQEVIKFVFGRDIIHKPRDIFVDDDPEKAMELVKAEIAHRMGRLAILSERIKELPEKSRTNEFTIRKLIADFQEEQQAQEARAENVADEYRPLPPIRR